MAHDVTACAMGVVASSDRAISDYSGNPATYVAGLALRRKSDDTLSVAVADGRWLGVSLGRSQSDISKTAVCRAGLRVPVLLESKPAYGLVTITSYANLVVSSGDDITIGATAFTAQSGAATPGDATFQAATTNEATATSLALQINSHATAGALVEALAVGDTVEVRALASGSGGNSIAFTYTDNNSEIGATVSGSDTLEDGGDAADYVVIGEKVYFSDVTGKADDPNSGSTISDAIYVTGVLAGIDEYGNTVEAALVDMPGGL